LEAVGKKQRGKEEDTDATSLLHRLFPTLQRRCHYSSFSTLLELNSNDIRPQKQYYKNDKEGGARKSPVLSRK